MKIVFLKSGKFSIDSIYGPVINCVEGKEIDIGEDDAEALLLFGWACRKDEVEDDGESTFEEAEVILEKPWERSDWDPKSPTAKDDLDYYSIRKHGISIDKRKKVERLITALKEIE